MRQRPSAFTIIELLVVVTIIVVLLALLAPALDKAVEQAERVLCASNLHHTTAALGQYALDMKRNYPEGQPAYRGSAIQGGRTQNSAGMGVFSVWVSPESVPDYGGYLGHGVLGNLRYADPKAFYCPSMTIPWMRYDATSGDQTVTVGGVVNAKVKAGGWPASNDPVGESYFAIYTAYHYRASFDGPLDHKPWRSPTMRKDEGHEPILADMFSHPDLNGLGRNVDHHHREGYNVARLGGSAGFVPDPDREVFKAHLDGQPYYAGAAEYLSQKKVWEEFFARR